MKPRLGCVPFLNAKPLVAWFVSGDAPTAEVIFENPSLLGPMVDRGQVDAAIASSFFAVSDPTLRIASGVSISSRGAVRSVRLFSKVPFGEIRRMALDSASMTSNHLAQIILQERYDIHPKCEPRKANLEQMLEDFDAAVLIGDVGMWSRGDNLHVLDLGEAWTEITSKPFVWAFWVGRNKLTSELAGALLTAKNHGVRNIAEIAEGEARATDRPVDEVHRYLTEAIDYSLSDAHWQGFEEYGKRCAEMGFVGRFSMPEVIGEASQKAPTS